MIVEHIFNAHWYGPYSVDKEELDTNIDENCVLYMICGTHGLYGRNVPLYIGQTAQKLSKRISQHDLSWLREEPDEVSIHAGYVAPFVSWEETAKLEEYPRLPGKTIDVIESLLIFAHQPAYNARAKQSTVQELGNVRLFNTGRRATLYPEVSSLHWIASPASQLNKRLGP
jgi:hypothetical protein